ncbi:putative bifunctional diguanylate cyclase/phosphodiesterase [Roseibium litorale]|uniref:GGDEF domain-containing protein n=1 Tax=Roseibium litorale TaxID=2803841 RepID=A0ABR9CQ90_9HYPH|nr:GGDEF domain-containing protein [Roseibium litorale]MBD8893026.1 GGDEF domain-containing protein [Roseibium litorale]
MPSKFGRGLNSIRIRFALMSFFFGSAAAYAGFWSSGSLQGPGEGYLVTGLVVLGAALGTYLMAGNLTRPIENLKASTEAIANGDYETPVNVECQCEVGGLADSFGKMVRRLNANVARIRTLAYEDAITGLPNRAALEEALNGETGLTGALLFIDLDHFKQVNDAYGHAAGDMVLREASKRLWNQGLLIKRKNYGRKTDEPQIAWESRERCLFRFAGDEFVAVLPGADRSEAALVANRIVEVMSEPFVFGGQIIQIGASVGAAILNEEACTLEDLIKFADLAMYEAKTQGRSRLVIFDQTMRDKAVKRARMTADLVAGLDRGELEVHFQPKIRLSDGSISSVEALVRWRHPELGLLTPGEFLEIAAESGLLPKLGQEVVRQSAECLKTWKKIGLPLVVAINICPGQFANEKFADSFILFCLSQEISPADFEIELTETVAMANFVKVRRQLERLKAAGFGIAIDDYGIGYSNLSQLYHLPFDHLKIDKSIIDSIGNDPNAEVLISSVIDVAHRLGHFVTAEGVETERQLDVLRRLGCDSVQGYLTGRPVPAAEISRLLEAQMASRAQHSMSLERQAAC